MQRIAIMLVFLFLFLIGAREWVESVGKKRSWLLVSYAYEISFGIFNFARSYFEIELTIYEEIWWKRSKRVINVLLPFRAHYD